MKYFISYNWRYKQASGFGWVAVTLTDPMTEEALLASLKDIAAKMGSKYSIDPAEFEILPLFWRPF